MPPSEVQTYEVKWSLIIPKTIKDKRRFVSLHSVIASSSSILNKVLHFKGTELLQQETENIEFVKIDSAAKK